MGFLITQIPKHFQPEALQTYRETKRKEMEEAALEAAAKEEQDRIIAAENAYSEAKDKQRAAIAERFRTDQGIELRGVFRSPDADEVLKAWAKRHMESGYRYWAKYI